MNDGLHFRADGGFKLMQLTDIHYTTGGEDDRRTLALMRELIAAERPDAIVVTGDTVFGADNLAHLEPALAPVLESGIPWAMCLGNHDSEYANNREALFERVCALPGGLTTHDPASGDGFGNCVLELKNGDGAAEWLLFLMDSGDYSAMPGVEGYGFVTSRQIRWYRDQIARREGDFGAMVFMHIPLPEHDEVWYRETCYGVRREEVCCPEINTGFFAAMLEAGHARGVFVGHDHVNDYWGRRFGIALGYGRCTGFGTYGAQDYLRGCRIFRFTQGNTLGFETYERLEHGVVVDDPWVQRPQRG